MYLREFRRANLWRKRHLELSANATDDLTALAHTHDATNYAKECCQWRWLDKLAAKAKN
jgi:hypothetical protein